MGMEHWWNDDGTVKVLEAKPAHCHLVHHTTHMD